MSEDERIAELQRRYQKVTEKLSRVSRLSPGCYSFSVELAEFKEDIERKYTYLYIQFRTDDGSKASDRFPMTDDMIWKLAEFVDAVGLTMADLSSDTKVFIGRTGKLTARTKGEWTIYEYQGKP
jgi:hypothetical protein